MYPRAQMVNDAFPEEALLSRFERISVFSRGETRAVHKPLLLLVALAQARTGTGRWLRFNTTRTQLDGLIERFGGKAKSTRADAPYWRLVNDGVWELPEAAALDASRNKHGAISPKALRDLDARAGFPDEIYAQIAGRPELIDRIALRIIEKNFPENRRREVLDAVGLPSNPTK